LALFVFGEHLMAYVSDRQHRQHIRNLQQQVDALAERIAKLEQEELPATAVTQADDVPASLADIVGPPAAKALEGAGYTTPESIQKASDEDLTAVKGVGPASVEKLREAFA
jgi:predicted flap endonuclease-1-like 5' DNA nuclease